MDADERPTAGRLSRRYQAWVAPSRTNPPLYLSERDLAFVIGVSPRSIRNWVNKGLIPRIKIGRRVLFRWATVQAALEKLERRCG
jgi:excisionase family DNA binding protein